ncbi:MAG: adenosine deaminase [Anaerolineae bacterium]|nr:adenosine deaminase [Anaerolineae bacterium]
MQRWPKVELHLHLDCSLSYDAVKQIDPDFAPDRYVREILGPRSVKDLAGYLARTRASVALLQTERALRIVVRDLFRQLADDNVLYAEIRFAPLLHLERGLSPENVVRTVLNETNRAVQRTGIAAGLILCTLRHFTERQGMVTARLLERFSETRVVALDLAGDEANYPLTPHVAAFEFARKHGLPRTAHAGEAAGPDSVREVLARLQPLRIGHGVRSVEDSTLMAELEQRRVHLEVCPACNVQVNVFEAWGAHPVDILYRLGIPLSLNTDGRTLTPTTLTSDYAQMKKTFKWQPVDFLACNIQAARAAFAAPDLKRQIERRLREGYRAVV